MVSFANLFQEHVTAVLPYAIICFVQTLTLATKSNTCKLPENLKTQQENKKDNTGRRQLEQAGRKVTLAQSIAQKGFRDNSEDLLNVIAPYSQVFKMEKKNIKTFFKVSNKRSSSSKEKLLKKNHPKEKKSYRENLLF